MSEPRPAAPEAAVRGALFGASAAGVLATAEVLAMAWLPALAGDARPPPALALPGTALLAATWIGLGAAAGAAVAAALRPAAASLPALALLPVALGWSAHAIAFASPRPRLAFVLAGVAALAALCVAAAVWPRWAPRLRAAANPWSASVLLVGLGVLELDLLRHAPLGQQALAAAGLAAAVAALAWLLARLRPPAPAPRGGRSLAAMLLGLGLALASAGHAARPPAPALPARPVSGSPPPIVLVTLDTVRSDHLSLYGYERETSPRLAAFAARATLHRRAIAASDLTLSTHASLMSGLYAREHGARVHATGGAGAIAPGPPLLAEILRERGYRTLAVVANAAYLAARYGFDRGFDHYDDRPPPPPLPDPRPHLASRSLVRGLRALGVGDEALERAETAYRRAREINREVFALLDQPALADAPFFLFVNYMDAHWPYDPPPPFDRRFPGRIETPAERPDGDAFRAARTGTRPPTPAQRRHLVSQYDGGIAYVDEQLGALLERLEARGLLDRSLVVITSDHGEAFGEHGLFAHGVSVHQHQVHVPLLVKLPGQRAPSVSERWTSSVDLLPTVLELLGLEPPGPLPGRSWLRERPGLRAPVIAESYPDSALVRASPRFRRVQRAVFSGDHKLVVPDPGRAKLYDLARDPHERQPASASAPPGPRLASALEAWLRGGPGAEVAPVPLDAATAERLRALGYGR